MTSAQIAAAQRLAREWKPKTWDELKDTRSLCFYLEEVKPEDPFQFGKALIESFSYAKSGLDKEGEGPGASEYGSPKSMGELARISHHLTAEARDRPAITSLRLLAVLTVLSSTPPLVKRRAPRTDGPLTHFASPRGEKSGLVGRGEKPARRGTGFFMRSPFERQIARSRRDPPLLENGARYSCREKG